MRQAGRYLPEFKKIRKNNPNFIKLCLNHKLSYEITLQPLKRFNLSAAIIFSDILMTPYGLGQEVNFKKNFGPQLGEIEINNIAFGTLYFTLSLETQDPKKRFIAKKCNQKTTKKLSLGNKVYSSSKLGYNLKKSSIGSPNKII